MKNAADLVNVHHNVNLSVSHETYLIFQEAQRLWPRQYPTIEVYILERAFEGAQEDIRSCE
jgi:hypothetical protein